MLGDAALQRGGKVNLRFVEALIPAMRSRGINRFLYQAGGLTRRYKERLPLVPWILRNTLARYGGLIVKLAIIAGFLAALAYFNADLFLSGQWKLEMPKQELTWSTIRMLAGSLIVVQGFETSRFLGSKYSADERIRTMRVAQILSGLIYIAFIGLIAVVFKTNISNSETGIIDLSLSVSTFLPATLIVAAVLSQFSAAIADTIGSGGLLAEALGKRTSIGTNYLIVGVLGVGLIWTFDIYGIINFASRAFALYYGLQAVEATALFASARDWYRTVYSSFPVMKPASLIYFLASRIRPNTTCS
jgi:hypothetical protein